MTPEQAFPGYTEYKSADKEVRVIQVICTTLLRRGNGTTTPIRCITQYWSMEGDLLAEIDPLPRVSPPTEAK